MKQIPETGDTLVLRTDYANDKLWEDICQAIFQPVGDFRAYVEFLSNPEYDNATIPQIISALPQNYNHSILFIVDHVTLAHPEHPILCIDLYDQPGRSFRVIPSEMWAVENNLSLANMDFDEFASAVDPDGIHRGYEGDSDWS